MSSMETSWRTLGLAALAPIAWGSGYYVTETFLPPDRPLFGALVRALPCRGPLLALRPRLPQGIWWWRALVLAGANPRLPRRFWWWRALVLGTLRSGAFFVLIFIAGSKAPGGTWSR